MRSTTLERYRERSDRPHPDSCPAVTLSAGCRPKRNRRRPEAIAVQLGAPAARILTKSTSRRQGCHPQRTSMSGPWTRRSPEGLSLDRPSVNAGRGHVGAVHDQGRGSLPRHCLIVDHPTGGLHPKDRSRNVPRRLCTGAQFLQQHRDGVQTLGSCRRRSRCGGEVRVQCRPDHRVSHVGDPDEVDRILTIPEHMGPTMRRQRVGDGDRPPRTGVPGHSLATCG